jgi:hypothetical protein
MADKLVRLYGPAALTATYTTNIYQGGGGSALIADEINHIHICNKGAAAATFRIYLGGTGANAAGTELFYDVSIAVGAVYPWYGRLKLTSADFLVGGASLVTHLVITIMGKQYVV